MEPTGIEREPECRKSPVKYFNKSAVWYTNLIIINNFIK